MTQQPLDRVHVDARLQQMGREGVTQGVNAARLRDTGSAFGGLVRALEAGRIHRVRAMRRRKQPRRGVIDLPVRPQRLQQVRREDRVAILPALPLLEALRAYWKIYHPTTWLFPSPHGAHPLDPSGLQRAYHTAKRRAGITKPGGIHALRHAFATHLLEAGVDVHTIQRLLGHQSIQTTTRYWHLTHASLTTQATRLELLDSPTILPPA